MTQDVTNGRQTRSLKHLCIGDMSPPAYIKYLSLTPHVKSPQCLHVDSQEGPCFCTIEYLVKFLTNCPIFRYFVLFSPAFFACLLLVVHLTATSITHSDDYQCVNRACSLTHSLTHACFETTFIFIKHFMTQQQSTADVRRILRSISWRHNQAPASVALQPATTSIVLGGSRNFGIRFDTPRYFDNNMSTYQYDHQQSAKLRNEIDLNVS